jgi:flagellar hook-length control protein FliK
MRRTATRAAEMRCLTVIPLNPPELGWLRITIAYPDGKEKVRKGTLFLSSISPPRH